jgi:hypothetical protein
MRFLPLQPLARVRSLSHARLLLRAGLWLTAASGAVAFLPFRRAIRLGCVELAGDRNLAIDDYRWAVEAASRRLPWRTMCIEKGVALQRLLRRAGVDAVLHYGVRAGEGGAPDAHVWVCVDGEPVIGGGEAKGFVEVANYPAES